VASLNIPTPIPSSTVVDKPILCLAGVNIDVDVDVDIGVGVSVTENEDSAVVLGIRTCPFVNST
jgi:hypothetical protein